MCVEVDETIKYGCGHFLHREGHLRCQDDEDRDHELSKMSITVELERKCGESRCRDRPMSRIRDIFLPPAMRRLNRRPLPAFGPSDQDRVNNFFNGTHAFAVSQVTEDPPRRRRSHRHRHRHHHRSRSGRRNRRREHNSEESTSQADTAENDSSREEHSTRDDNPGSRPSQERQRNHRSRSRRRRSRANVSRERGHTRPGPSRR